MRSSRLLIGLVALCGGGSVFGCAGGGGTSTNDVPSDTADTGDAGWEGDVAREDVTADAADVETVEDGAEEGDAVCVPTGEEICDGLDNDCDGLTDEDFVFATDPDNCGGCDQVCQPDHATGGCTDGDCAYTCEDGWVDLDGSGVNGCEYECTPTATAESPDDGTCSDGLDNDCDGRADLTDTDCALCVPELCNSADDDCDGLTDEDFNTDFDPANCGACGHVCPARSHATAACMLGACALHCASGWADLDGNPANGCESPCVPSASPDETTCNGVDDDCDGVTDEDFVGTACGSGLCRRTSVCVGGHESTCTPRTPPTSTDTTCDGVDDNCNGLTDEDGHCECHVDADCDDHIDCTDDSCVPGEGRCVHTADALVCSDGNICNGEEVCDLVLGCVAGTPIDCSDGIPCTSDTCNPLTGECSSSADHTRCTGGEICDPARSTEPSGCAPPAACATDADCDDHDHCNGEETCGALLLCHAGTPVSCDDGVACTADACHPADGSCTHTPPDVDGDTAPDAACGGTDCNDHDATIRPGAIDTCNGVDDNCDTVVDGGALCSPLPHAATASCIGGACVPNCDVGWGDCDGILTNGCDTSLTTLTNCGACAVACDLSRATESCATGMCRITSCDTPYGNCDGVDANGCEATLTTTTNCGACGVPCAPDHATGATCITGACAFSGCSPGWGNCDGNGANGCETSLYSLTDCGSCGHACDLPNATEACPAGTCNLVSCDSGWGNCNGTTGDGCETSLHTTTNCGTCGAPCALANAASSCSTGTCSLVSCNTGFGNCNGNDTDGCEISLATLTNCGTCGTPCSPGHASGATCASGSCNYSSCDTGYGNCDGLTANGCETSLRTLTDCGACGSGCDLAHASESCTTGSCTLMSCDSSFGNCDGNSANGCETSLTSLTNCGDCGVHCSPAHASGGTCASGSCSYGSCTGQWGDCNGIASDGCETSLTTLTDCGVCDSHCDLPNASESCSTGSCVLGTCNTGYGNCNGIATDGCETSLTSLTNCGTCGTPCALPNGVVSCGTGSCVLTGCASGYGNCDSNPANGCEASLYDPTHCGTCSTVCSFTNASATCPAGTCVLGACNTGFGNCDGNSANGCETSIYDPAHCGNCSTVCSYANASATCPAGTCVLGACNSGFGNCDGNSANGCETSVYDPAHCGNCSTVCSFANASATCPAGTCVLGTCSTGYGNCDGNSANGCETSLYDPAHCGTCSTTCSFANASATCPAGTCVLGTCNSGYGNCDGNSANGCETSLHDPAHCGTCSTVCSYANASATCPAGTCVLGTCNAGYGNCDGNSANGCETSVYDPAHCGNCSTVCSFPNASATCPAGTCLLGGCNSGYGNCDGNSANGCETSLHDPAHCGGCSTVCSFANASATCPTGTCVLGTCNTGYANCDGNSANGCETSIYDPAHCGNCSTVCSFANASATCPAGTCVLGTCNAGYGNCDGNSANGCETSIYDPAHCGNCSTVCSFPNASATCPAGSCLLGTCVTGYGNCDGNSANGCELSLYDPNHCGGCSTVCSFANAAATCPAGTCVMGACNAGYYNLDGLTSNGCECQSESPDAGGTCGTASNIGSFTDNPASSTDVTGKIPTTSDVDCYTFTATDVADTTGDPFHVKIAFTSNPSGEFKIDVYRGGCGTAYCTGMTDRYDWYVDQTPYACVADGGSPPTGTAPCGEGTCRVANTSGYNLCLNDSTTYTFCVSRVTPSVVNCDSYAIHVSNGAP